jgi:hypothetical protein
MADNPITSEIAALRRAKPKTQAEARVRATELARLQGILEEAARRAVDESAAKRLANGYPAGNGGGLLSITQEVWDHTFETVKKYIVDEFAVRDARIAELEAQQKDMLTDGDIWREATLYRRGAVVTHDGTIWVAREANSRARPGHSNAWRLMQKTKGR